MFDLTRDPFVYAKFDVYPMEGVPTASGRFFSSGVLAELYAKMKVKVTRGPLYVKATDIFGGLPNDCEPPNGIIGIVDTIEPNLFGGRMVTVKFFREELEKRHIPTKGPLPNVTDGKSFAVGAAITGEVGHFNEVSRVDSMEHLVLGAMIEICPLRLGIYDYSKQIDLVFNTGYFKGMHDSIAIQRRIEEMGKAKKDRGHKRPNLFQKGG